MTNHQTTILVIAMREELNIYQNQLVNQSEVLLLNDIVLRVCSLNVHDVQILCTTTVAVRLTSHCFRDIRQNRLCMNFEHTSLAMSLG